MHLLLISLSQIRKVLLCKRVITFSTITCLADSDQHHWYDILTWKLAGDNDNSICINHNIAAKKDGTVHFPCPQKKETHSCCRQSFQIYFLCCPWIFMLACQASLFCTRDNNSKGVLVSQELYCWRPLQQIPRAECKAHHDKKCLLRKIWDNAKLGRIVTIEGDN